MRHASSTSAWKSGAGRPNDPTTLQGLRASSPIVTMETPVMTGPSISAVGPQRPSIAADDYSFCGLPGPILLYEANGYGFLPLASRSRRAPRRADIFR